MLTSVESEYLDSDTFISDVPEFEGVSLDVNEWNCLISDIRKAIADGKTLEQFTTVCDQCEHNTATVYCPQDKAHFCDPCDYSHHSSSKLLGGHNRVPLYRSPLQFGNCGTHESELLECFCVDCGSLLCGKCVLNSGHDSSHEFLSTTQAFELSMAYTDAIAGIGPDGQQSVDQQSGAHSHEGAVSILDRFLKKHELSRFSGTAIRKMAAPLELWRLSEETILRHHKSLVAVEDNLQHMQEMVNRSVASLNSQLVKQKDERAKYLRGMKTEVSMTIDSIGWIQSVMSRMRLSLSPTKYLETCHQLAFPLTLELVLPSVVRFVGMERRKATLGGGSSFTAPIPASHVAIFPEYWNLWTRDTTEHQTNKGFQENKAFQDNKALLSGIRPYVTIAPNVEEFLTLLPSWVNERPLILGTLEVRGANEVDENEYSVTRMLEKEKLMKELGRDRNVKSGTSSIPSVPSNSSSKTDGVSSKADAIIFKGQVRPVVPSRSILRSAWDAIVNDSKRSTYIGTEPTGEVSETRLGSKLKGQGFVGWTAPSCAASGSAGASHGRSQHMYGLDELRSNSKGDSRSNAPAVASVSDTVGLFVSQTLAVLNEADSSLTRSLEKASKHVQQSGLVSDSTAQYPVGDARSVESTSAMRDNTVTRDLRAASVRDALSSSHGQSLVHPIHLDINNQGGYAVQGQSQGVSSLPGQNQQISMQQTSMQQGSSNQQVSFQQGGSQDAYQQQPLIRPQWATDTLANNVASDSAKVPRGIHASQLDLPLPQDSASSRVVQNDSLMTQTIGTGSRSVLLTAQEPAQVSVNHDSRVGAFAENSGPVIPVLPRGDPTGMLRVIASDLGSTGGQSAGGSTIPQGSVAQTTLGSTQRYSDETAGTRSQATPVSYQAQTGMSQAQTGMSQAQTGMSQAQTGTSQVQTGTSQVQAGQYQTQGTPQALAVGSNYGVAYYLFSQTPASSKLDMLMSILGLVGSLKGPSDLEGFVRHMAKQAVQSVESTTYLTSGLSPFAVYFAAVAKIYPEEMDTFRLGVSSGISKFNSSQADTSQKLGPPISNGPLDPSTQMALAVMDAVSESYERASCPNLKFFVLSTMESMKSRFVPELASRLTCSLFVTRVILPNFVLTLRNSVSNTAAGTVSASSVAKCFYSMAAFMESNSFASSIGTAASNSGAGGSVSDSESVRVTRSLRSLEAAISTSGKGAKMTVNGACTAAEYARDIYRHAQRYLSAGAVQLADQSPRNDSSSRNDSSARAVSPSRVLV